MNLLINQSELVGSVARHLLSKKFSTKPVNWSDLDRYVNECRAEYQRSRHITIDFNQVNQLINKEINQYRQDISADFKGQVKKLTGFLIEHKQFSQLPSDYLIKFYLQDPRPNFIKNIGPQLTNDCKYISNVSEADLTQPFLIRNIIHNEELLKICMLEKHPFWFIDSGYTNFLHGKRKVWHRLLQNHIHHGPVSVNYPGDRLHLLTELPRTWRKKGRTILVVESSESHYIMRGTTLAQWRDQITIELKKHTDRPIEFRSKEASRKTRNTVYSLLQNSKEYHCVVSDSSSAAIEAIWCGVPAITLGRHITNSVTLHSLSEVERLYRGEIELWLQAVSYNQFTFEELCNGTAKDITKTYGTL